METNEEHLPGAYHDRNGLVRFSHARRTLDLFDFRFNTNGERKIERFNLTKKEGLELSSPSFLSMSFQLFQ